MFCFLLTYLFRATNEDEMCNFYLMYYVDNGEPLERKYCFTPGPPKYYWSNSDTGLKNIPEFEASHLEHPSDNTIHHHHH